jgi:hypothetical protein
VGYVSQFLKDPREDHQAAAKHLLQYVTGTCGHAVVYPRGEGTTLELTGFNDSDMAGDVDGRQSTSGVLFKLGACPITWQLQK